MFWPGSAHYISILDPSLNKLNTFFTSDGSITGINQLGNVFVDFKKVRTKTAKGTIMQLLAAHVLYLTRIFKNIINAASTVSKLLPRVVYIASQIGRPQNRRSNSQINVRCSNVNIDFPSVQIFEITNLTVDLCNLRSWGRWQTCWLYIRRQFQRWTLWTLAVLKLICDKCLDACAIYSYIYR
jgi:hypothetical protein